MTPGHLSESWFRYFPGSRPDNYRWSAALALALGQAHWGAASLGEVDRVGQRLRDRVGDDEAWFAEWRRLGDQVRGLAQEAERDGHSLTAAGAYLRACCYYQWGERFRTPKDSEALGVYRTAVECFHRYAALVDWPHIEVVEVPYQGGSLPAYLAHTEAEERGRVPCVVFFDGLDITKELQYAQGVPELTRRGIACLVVDGPGNGESIRFRGLPLRYDYELAGSAAFDYLETHSEIDAQRIAVMGISLGGYYAPRCAAKEPRFAACVAWGAIWDYHAIWKRRIEAAYNTALSVPAHHITWVFQVNTIEEVLQKLEDFRLDGVAQGVRCPFLLLHGERDAQIPVEDSHALFQAVGSQDKHLKIFTEEEGGAQHCQADNTILAITYLSDWLREKLQASAP
ncbi:MAG: alpha/beta hydrolase family protein [Dehalococcoidia bacterium]